MKIVIVNGSARKGNTLTAIQAFAEGVAEENCPTEHVSSRPSVKVATPPCAAKAAIPCGLAGGKRF